MGSGQFWKIFLLHSFINLPVLLSTKCKVLGAWQDFDVTRRWWRMSSRVKTQTDGKKNFIQKKISAARGARNAVIICRLPGNVTACHKSDNLDIIKFWVRGIFHFCFSGSVLLTLCGHLVLLTHWVSVTGLKTCFKIKTWMMHFYAASGHFHVSWRWCYR